MTDTTARTAPTTAAAEDDETAAIDETGTPTAPAAQAASTPAEATPATPATAQPTPPAATSTSAAATAETTAAAATDAATGRDGGRPAAANDAALFDAAAAKDLQGRWQVIQVAFVDEPRGAVQQADQLVDEVLTKLQESFARERQELERAWSGGSEASTEDLRQAIRRYRSFFNRLLSI